MAKQPRISFLAIGTELTNGQIINRNAAWVSAQLAEIGVQTSGHWTVPDDRDLIQKTMNLSSETSDLIFISGGLGPTTDDFTREMIAEWTKLPLEWHEESWTHIQERLGTRGIAAKEIQKQQCFYPRGAVVLKNSQGTANAFRLTAKGKTWIALPGPPREIEAIWKDHLQDWLPSQFPELDPWITRSWDTLGYPESVIAQLTEETLTGSHFEVGYRVHIPFVEVKLSFTKSRATEARSWIEKLEVALAPYTVLRDRADSMRLLSEHLEKFAKILIVDEISKGYLLNRLTPVATKLWGGTRLIWSNQYLKPREEDLTLRLYSEESGKARATLCWKGVEQVCEIVPPTSAALLKDREGQYFAELATLFWIRQLEALVL